MMASAASSLVQETHETERVPAVGDEQRCGLELVAAARSAAHALAVTTEPTIALLDLHLPDGDGINLGTTLKHRWPHLRPAARGTLVLGHGAHAAVIAAAAAAPPPTALAALDSRDLQILQLLIQGLPTAQVAARLFLAPKTIRNRVSEMLDKLGVATRDEAIALGRASGLGTPHNRAV